MFLVLAADDFVHARKIWGEMRSLQGWESFTFKQSFLAVVKGVSCPTRSDANTNTGSRPPTPTVLTPGKILGLARSKRIKFDESPSDAWISARCASDSVAKLVALVQASWFTANTIYRLANHYIVSPLEDLTIAYVFCGLGMFLFWFRCPQKLQERFIIEVDRLPSDSELARNDSGFNRVGEGMSGLEVILIIMFSLSAFVGIHLTAWNYPFPTIVEAWLWRVGAFVTLVLGGAPGAFASAIPFDKESVLNVTIASFLGTLYVLCRIMILILALMAFRASPAHVYAKPSWDSYWVHL